MAKLIIYLLIVLIYFWKADIVLLTDSFYCRFTQPMEEEQKV